MKVAHTEADLALALSTAANEAKSAFGDASVYLEKYLQKPRHIEIQILGDGRGGALHLAERDCPLPRRHPTPRHDRPSPAPTSAAPVRPSAVRASGVTCRGVCAASQVSNRRSLSASTLC